jgi:hypothetical protein
MNRPGSNKTERKKEVTSGFLWRWQSACRAGGYTLEIAAAPVNSCLMKTAAT